MSANLSNNDKEAPYSLDEYERNNWRHLEFKDHIEQFSIHDEVISPLHAFLNEPHRKNDQSIGFPQVNNYSNPPSNPINTQNLQLKTPQPSLSPVLQPNY